MESTYLRAFTKLVILPFTLIVIASCGSNGSTDNVTNESGTATDDTSVVSNEQTLSNIPGDGLYQLIIEEACGTISGDEIEVS